MRTSAGSKRMRCRSARRCWTPGWVVVSSVGTSVPGPFLVVLVFWLTMIFVSFGLFAPRNATVIVALCVCALSVAGAIFLILEMDSPFEGLMKISPDPLRYAYARINQ